MRKVLAALAVAVTMLTGATPASAADHPLSIDATLDGRRVEGAGSNDPVKLWPEEITEVVLTVSNSTGSDVTVRRARLFGEAFDLTFVAYDAVTTVVVPAGSTVEIEIPVEFIDLEKQATGLLPGGFQLFDSDREVVAEQRFVIDVRGSASSALGLFGMFVAVSTVIGIITIVLAVKKRTLGPKRWRRAVRFGSVGLGFGLTIVMSFAVFRVLAPTGSVWIPLTVIPTLAAAVLGMVSPGSLALEPWGDDDIDDDLDADLDELAASVGLDR